jgi:heptosyltransferase-1
MRILIVRLRAIGDVIHGLPVACAVKDFVPGAFVAWLAEDWASEVLAGHPAIDQRVAVPQGWTRSVPRILRLRRELRALRFDVVLDLQGVRSSVFAAILSGAPRRLGFVGMVSHEARWLVTNEDSLRALSRAIAGVLHFELVQASSDLIVDRYLEILSPLGVNVTKARFGLPELEEDAREIGRMLHDVGVGCDQSFAVVNSGGPLWRMWPADRFAAVARYLGSTHRMPTMVVQGLRDREQQAAGKIVAESGGHARLAPPLSLGQLSALARRSRMFISGDTGPLHLAAAVGAPCIGLIGHDLAGRVRPYGAVNILVRGKPMSRHQASREDLGVEAMKAISVDDVCRACDRLLLSTPASDAHGNVEICGNGDGRSFNLSD